MNKNKIITISGPTCTSKSEIAVALAHIINGEIISCDSMQIYKHMDIGTAKINEDEKENISHFMISEIEPTESFNIKSFKERTYKYINEITNRKHTPILVGGTGFYLNSIIYDNDFPYEDYEKNAEIKKELDQIEKIEGKEALYKILKEIDIESYNKIDKNNIYRIKRAITYFKLHNEKISTHNELEKLKKEKFDGKYICLIDDRDNLYKRIDKRVDKMFSQGLIDEVKALIKLGVNKNSQSMSAIGYRELYDYCFNEIKNIKNDISLDEIKEKIKQHSRNYAKRQLTWFKTKKNFHFINIKDFSYSKKNIVKKILEI